MADTITLPGGGVVVASDDILGVQYQRIKLIHGADGVNGGDVASTNPLPVTPLNATPDITASGTLTAAAQTVVLSLAGQSGAAVQVGGTWVGTLTFEASLDGTTWYAINAVSASTSQPQSTTTVNGLYRATPAGTQQMRVNMTAFTSGSASVLMRAGVGTGGVFANQILPTKITDGTNSAAIKAASTAAAATDPAVVVAISPNNAVAVTGTFFQATQPVSLTSTTITGSVAVTGGLTDTQLRATAVPVSGAFFQATQPVSLTSTTITGTVAATKSGAYPVDTAAKGTTVAGNVTSEATDANTQSLHARVTNASLAVTGTFFQATQPVSIATNTPDVTDRAARALGTIANTAFTANAGTNLNTSALALDATLTGGTTKAIARGGVKGTAVAGDITSNPVDANTQALHVNLAGANAVNATLTAETTKVIGTVNVAASQTVGLVAGAAVIGSLAANQSVNTAQINGIAPLMGNGITGTGSQRVTIASDNTAFPVNSTLTAETTKVIGTINIAASQTVGLVAGTAVVGALIANQSINTAQINGVAPLMGNGVTGTGSQRVTIASDNTAFAVNATLTAETTKVIGTVNPPAITKGTQGTTGVTVQALNDAGRNPVHFYTVIPVLTSATDTLQSLTGTKAGATVAATTTPAVVTAGKTFRVTRVAATYVATATSGYGIVRLRFNTGGVVAITSPVAATMTVGAGTPATANSLGFEEASLTDGWEFAAGTGVGISAQGFAAVTATAVGYVTVSLTGYEY